MSIRNEKGQFKRGHNYIIIPEKICISCGNKYQPTTNGQKRCGSMDKKIGCSYQYFLEYVKEKRKLQTIREKQNPEYSIIMRDRRLKNKYNISQEDYKMLVEKQNKKCLICLDECDSLRIDHCHNNGHIRGLLCDSCNLGLGKFKDNVESLKNAIKYLEKNGK